MDSCSIHISYFYCIYSLPRRHARTKGRPTHHTHEPWKPDATATARDRAVCSTNRSGSGKGGPHQGSKPTLCATERYRRQPHARGRNGTATDGPGHRRPPQCEHERNKITRPQPGNLSSLPRNSKAPGATAAVPPVQWRTKRPNAAAAQCNHARRTASVP